MKITMSKNGVAAISIDVAVSAATRRTLLTPALNELNASLGQPGTYAISVVVTEEDAAKAKEDAAKRAATQAANAPQAQVIPMSAAKKPAKKSKR